MKKLTVFILLFTIVSASVLFSASNKPAAFWVTAQAMTDTAAAMQLLDDGIAKILTKSAANAEDLHNYTQAVNVKYYYLGTGTDADKKEAYKKVITAFEKLPPEAAKTASYNADLALMWARIGEISDLIESASNGMADKIKKYSEDSLKIDPAYDNGEVNVLIGRLYYKAPNIPFIVTWPDKKVAKKYIETALVSMPDSLIAKFFLADTLWELGEKEKATALYKEVAAAAPRPALYIKDVKSKKLCEARMKELGL